MNCLFESTFQSYGSYPTFHKVLGTTPMQYLLNYTADMLINTDLNITEQKQSRFEPFKAKIMLCFIFLLVISEKEQ